MITLTSENLHAGQTGAGGFKKAQVEALGLTWPVSKGWLRGLIGTQVTEEAYAAFLRAKDRKPVAPTSADIEKLAEMGLMNISLPPTPPGWVDELALDYASAIHRRTKVGQFHDLRAVARIQCELVDIIMRELGTPR